MAKAKQAAEIDFELVVIQPFGDYQRGQRISDPEAIAAVLDSENASHANKVTKPQ